MKNLKITIRKLRKQAGLSSTELAKKSGLSLAYISKLEKGIYQALSLKTCKQLAHGLGLSLKDFLEKLGYLDENKKSPGSQIINQAFRSKGYTVSQVEQIINYAKFIKNGKNQYAKIQ